MFNNYGTIGDRSNTATYGEYLWWVQTQKFAQFRGKVLSFCGWTLVIFLDFRQNFQFHNSVCDRRFWCDDKKSMSRSARVRYKFLCSCLQSSRRRTMFEKSNVRRQSLFDWNQMFAWVFDLWTSPNGKSHFIWVIHSNS